MRILGISASYRKWGNTDILVRHVLKGAKEEGADTRFVRLTDFDIEQCHGCMACLFKNRSCIIEDQLHPFLDQLTQAEAIVIGSPIHILFAAGSIQMLLPRLIRQGYTRELSGKPGIAIAVGGRPGWEGLALQQLVTVYLALGMPVVDCFTAYGQGPGEVFFDKVSCNRALEGGKHLANGKSTFRGEVGICPVCHGDLVVTNNNGQPYCKLCDLKGEWAGDGYQKLEPYSGVSSRWFHQENVDHFEKLILPSGQRFSEKKETIRNLLADFKRSLGDDIE